MSPPGSWELYKASINRVLIGVLAPPDMRLTMRWMDNATQIQQRAPLGSGLSRMSGLPFGHARNVILKQALDNGFGYCFMLDADTLPPVDVIPRLLETGRDLIGAFYTQRYPFDGVHFKAAAAMMGPGGQRGDLPPFNWGDIIPVHFLPMGATLISRRCMEAVLAKFPRPFEWQIDIDRPAGGLSEDFDFSAKAASVGYIPYLHCGLVCGHETTAHAMPGGLVVPGP